MIDPASTRPVGSPPDDPTPNLSASVDAGERGHQALECSASGGLVLRLDDVVIVRGSYGTWLMDLQVDVGTDRLRLQVPIGRHKALDRLATDLARADTQQR